MGQVYARTTRWLAAATAAASLFYLAPVQAADIAPTDLDAAVRTFGFVDSLQRRTPIMISVVYRTGDNDAKAQAQRAAQVLASMQGPHSAPIVATAVAENELGQAGRHTDVLFVTSSVAEGRAVADFARRQRILSISNDPGRLNAQCCTLIVRASARTEIILDTAQAQETGTTFSLVFMMMVKRR